ncbi:hypothetical protein CFIMG_001963RA [Ceratocystis fimbriata CBS 114723]|uniref:Uncharacterized protein n=1 Tax=Ceratocystis fimbriata CBS 114723 TaxID=1035309 RepID=A0A2C5X3T1_9PEZI|nr:hypothetical protein CFIMG_001963RA [Ceratocystis fimbriata CBS 114723]
MQGPSAGPTTAQELLALTQSQQQSSFHHQQPDQVNRTAIGLNPTTIGTSNLPQSRGPYNPLLRNTVLAQSAPIVKPDVAKEMRGSTTTGIPGMSALRDLTVPTRSYSNPGLDSRSLLSNTGIATAQQRSKSERLPTTPQAARTYRPESGFVSPGELKRSLESSFVDSTCELHRMINGFPADVVRRVIRENWSKCLSGSMYHRAFILNISLSRAEDFAKPSVLSFGARIVKLCTAEIAEHLDSTSIDTISEKILEKASPEFLDKAMAERLKTIDSRNLLNMLARAERLGYTMDDVLDDDVQDEEDEFMVDMDIVTTDIPPNSESAPSQEAQDAADKDIAKDTQNEVITNTTTPESELGLESEGESEGEAELEPELEPELEHEVKLPCGKHLSFYNVYFPQKLSLAEGFSPKISCSFCQMIFPSLKAKQVHTTIKACLKPRRIKKDYGCRFCGTSLSSIQSLKLHAAKRTCGDYSRLGQSISHPNGTGFPNLLSTPYAIPKAMRPQKLGSESKPDPIETKTSNASATSATSAPTEADTIKKDEKKAHDKTSEHPNPGIEPAEILPSPSSPRFTPLKASEAIPQPSQEFLDKHKGNPIAHLTREQIVRLQWEIQETQKWYGPLIEKAIKEDDKSRVDAIRNCMTTKISTTRKRYGVRMPKKGGRYSDLVPGLSSGLGDAPDKTALVATGEPTTELAEKRPLTPAKPTNTLAHPQKMDAKPQMQETTPKSGAGGSLPKAGKAGATRPSSASISEAEDSDIEREPLSVRRRKAFKRRRKAPRKPTQDVAARPESPMYISSSDDADSDDSIPARLPRPALQ